MHNLWHLPAAETGEKDAKEWKTSVTFWKGMPQKVNLW